MKDIDITRELKEGGITFRTLFAAFSAGALAALAGILGIHPSRIYAGLSMDGRLLLWFSVYSVILYFAFRFLTERRGERRPGEP
ncbi:MAG: hypothetical protein JW821_15780 [Deltaproteobacteria bacterium]|nr:hypothetical protein [Deltaproteobacteria bacterium]